MFRLSRRQALTGLALTATATGRTTMPSWPIDLVDDLGNRLAGTLTTTSAAAAQPPPPLLLGVDCSTADLATDLATYPAMAYHRIFGAALPRHDAGKMAALPTSCIPHVSWKTWDLDALIVWLDGLTRSIYLSWYHEPMGNVAPAEYRATGAVLSKAVSQHPNGHLILGHGPILTRYWLDQANGNPDDWWYDGATFHAVDCYNGLADRYRDPEDMFGTAVELGLRYGVPVLIPEWGAERTTGADFVSGAKRAQLLRDSVTWLRANHVRAAAWWNIGGDRLTAHPEQATLQTLVHMQAQP